jgi:hypothetical protein
VTQTAFQPAAPPPKPQPPKEAPGIAGPSFLGLNQPPDRRSTTHHERPSGNLDYLLEDDEEPKRSGGKIALIVIALLLVAGLGYLRWRHDGFAWLTSGAKKPAPGVQLPDAPPSSAGAVQPDQSATSNPVSPPAGATQPASSEAPAAQSTAPATSAPSNTTDATSSPLATSPPVPGATSTLAKEASSAPSNTSGEPAAKSEPDKGTEAAETPQPESAPVRRSRVIPKPAAAKPSDPVTLGEKYIYGRGGARQDCDRGLKILRPAAEQSNPKAMIALGALYSTGTCAPRDLPTAYRWFALALRKEPDNQSLQDNMQHLWGQMTQPERQLAIRLSQ